MKVLISSSTSPLFNLQKECNLLSAEDSMLFLYRNTPSVILGKYQSIRSEVDLDFCIRQNIEILRRPTGGGAVYHDLGNINWAFISNKTEISLLDTNPCLPIVRFLDTLALHAEIGSRNELTINGLKISGTASKVTKARQLFHGTLLYNSDLSVLSQALQGDTTRRGRAIASVPSQVVNLSSMLDNAPSTEEFLRLMACFFTNYAP